MKTLARKTAQVAKRAIVVVAQTWTRLDTDGRRCNTCGREMSEGERILRQQVRVPVCKLWRTEFRAHCEACGEREVAG